jgi:SAM-dependent methyltransferase
VKVPNRIMEQTQVYRLWQAPFAERKFAPVLAHNNLRQVRRILDVGCGPGTNAHHFAHTSYVGIDCNPAYIEHAKRKNPGTFIVADATTYRVESNEGFDFILVNSFLHHIDTPNALRILAHLSTLLTPKGHIHILELVLPEGASVARLLARMDRGDFPRPLRDWLSMVKNSFAPRVVEPYALTAFGITLWNMVYLKCEKKI